MAHADLLQQPCHGNRGGPQAINLGGSTRLGKWGAPFAVAGESMEVDGRVGGFTGVGEFTGASPAGALTGAEGCSA